MSARSRGRAAVPLVFALILAGLVLRLALGRTHDFHADPSKASRFLTSYSPQESIDRFAVLSFGSGLQSGASSGGGRDSVTNERDFGRTVVLCDHLRDAVMEALRNDLVKRLQLSQASEIREAGEDHGGIRFSYRFPNILGSITLSPVSNAESVYRKTPLPAGLNDVTVKVKATEVWYRTAAEAAKNGSPPLLPEASAR